MSILDPITMVLLPVSVWERVQIEIQWEDDADLRAAADAIRIAVADRRREMRRAGA